MKRISSILLIILTLSSTTFKAQHAMGLVVGDFNSPYSCSLNPALSRTNPSNRAYINWWGASVSLENNFMQYKAPFRLGAWIDQNYPAQYADINGSLAFQQDCTVYKTKLSAAETELIKLKAELAVLQADKAKADLALSEAKKSLVDAKSLQDEIARLKAQIAVLEKEKATVVDSKPLQDEIARLKAQIAVLEKEKATVVNCVPIKAEVEKLKAQIAVLEKEKAAVVDCSVCDQALAESKAALVLAEAKIKALEADKVTCAAQLAELKKQQAATITLQADNESLKKKLSEVEERVSELEMQLGASDKSAELNAEIIRLKEEIKKKDNQISGCNLLADKCTKKTVELEAKLATSEKDRALLNTQYEDLKRQIITMDEDMGKLGEIIKSNNAEISKLNAEMLGLRTRLKECETKLNAATAPKEETPN